MKKSIAEAGKVIFRARKPGSLSAGGCNGRGAAFRCAVLALLALGLFDGVSRAQDAVKVEQNGSVNLAQGAVVAKPDGGVSVAKDLTVGNLVIAARNGVAPFRVTDPAGNVYFSVGPDRTVNLNNKFIVQPTGQVAMTGLSVAPSGETSPNDKLYVKGPANIDGTLTAGALRVNETASLGNVNPGGRLLTVGGDVTIVGKLNGVNLPLAPLKLAFTPNSENRWNAYEIDIRDRCGDPDGCRITFLMERGQDSNFFTADVYMDQPVDNRVRVWTPENTLQASKRWMLPSKNQELIFDPHDWKDWCQITNYLRGTDKLLPPPGVTSWTVGSPHPTPDFIISGGYNAVFRCAPNITARINIFAR